MGGGGGAVNYLWGLFEYFITTLYASDLSQFKNTKNTKALLDMLNCHYTFDN